MWSISMATSIAWVFTAYLLTVMAAFLQTNDSDVLAWLGLALRAWARLWRAWAFQYLKPGQM
jgi:hypothetical protein